MKYLVGIHYEESKYNATIISTLLQTLDDNKKNKKVQII